MTEYKCAQCGKEIIKCKAMAKGLMFCDFECLVEYNKNKEKRGDKTP